MNRLFERSELVLGGLLAIVASFIYHSLAAGVFLGSTMVLFWASFRTYAIWEGNKNGKNLVTLVVAVLLFSWSAYELSVVRYSTPGDVTHVGEGTTWFAAPHKH